MAVLLNDQENINVTLNQEPPINTSLPDINYIPGYKVAEEERRANEVVRQANEQDRIALYEDLEYKVETDYYKGDKGDKGDTGDSGPQGEPGPQGQPGQDGYSPTATVTKTGKIATITIIDKDGETTAEIRDGEDGSGTGDMLKATYDTNDNGIVDNAEKVNNHTVESDVPSNAIFTDTTYTAGSGIDITNGVISNTQTSANWGNITGTLSDQTDLQNALDGKADNSDIPTKTSDLTNDSGFITGVPRVDETHWNGYTFVKGDGVMEIGKYIDFHNDTLGTDKSLRLVVQGNYNNNVNLPTASGTLALTSDIVDDEVLVGDESQATSNTKLIVESDDLEPQGLEIANEYNTATNMAYSCDYLNDCETYSTDEVKTNKIWVDGKPIYRKVLSIGSVSAGTTKDISVSSLNISELFFNTSNSYIKSGSIFLTIPRVHNSDATAQVEVRSTTTTLSIRCGAGITIDSGYITIEYTKTTD